MDLIDPSGRFTMVQSAFVLTSVLTVAIIFNASNNGDGFEPTDFFIEVPSGPIPRDLKIEPNCDRFLDLCVAACAATHTGLFGNLFCRIKCAALFLGCAADPESFFGLK